MRFFQDLRYGRFRPLIQRMITQLKIPVSISPANTHSHMVIALKGKLRVQSINTKAHNAKRRANNHPKVLLNTKPQSLNPSPANLAPVYALINAVQRQKPDTSFPPQSPLNMLQAQYFLRSSQPPPQHLGA